MSTVKQKATFVNVMENRGKAVSVAMAEEGYDLTTAKNPKNLTDSKGWKELLEQYLPDNKLLIKHEAALEAKKWNDFTGEREPDHTTVLKAVDMAYKLKGYLSNVNLQQFNVGGDMSLEFIKQE